MDTCNFKSQSTSTRCSIAVIRAILYYFENKDFTEDCILKDFPTSHNTNGTDIDSIKCYWNNKIQYSYEKKDDQTSDDMEYELVNNNRLAMVIQNTSVPGIFHCVLFNGIINNKVKYWDPDPSKGLQIVDKCIFDNMRFHDNENYKFREIHYISLKN
jgi:hypothetical protein